MELHQSFLFMRLCLHLLAHPLVCFVFIVQLCLCLYPLAQLCLCCNCYYLLSSSFSVHKYISHTPLGAIVKLTTTN